MARGRAHSREGGALGVGVDAGAEVAYQPGLTARWKGQSASCEASDRQDARGEGRLQAAGGDLPADQAAVE